MRRVAIAQVSGPSDGGADNRARTVAAIEAAFREGANVVVLPELIVPGYGWDRRTILGASETIDGETVHAWSELAREHGGLVVGGFAERDGDRLFNSAVLVDGAGVRLHYRKLHLFSGESTVFTPGNLGLQIAETEHGIIGLCICYDLRFVETLRVLSLRGAALVCVPTAWVPGFDDSLWDADGYCVQARGALLQANLNGVFVACASQAAANGARPDFLGSSVIGDPRGRTLAGPLPGNRDGIVLADIDLDEISATRDRGNGIRPIADRRTDVYAIEVGGQRL